MRTSLLDSGFNNGFKKNPCKSAKSVSSVFLLLPYFHFTTFMPSNKKEELHLLIIVNSLYAWSQNFITRELTELYRQKTRMHIATRKVVERDDLSNDEKQLSKNVILMPENPFGPSSLIKHFKTAKKRPAQYRKAWQALPSLQHRFLSNKYFRSIICLFRAAAIAEEVLAKKINLIHAHFLTAPGDTAVYLSKMTGIPFGGTGHAMDIYVDNSGLLGKIAHASYLTTCTGANEKHLRTLPIKNLEKVHKLYHGIQILESEPKMEKHQPFAFLAVGRMVEKKGFTYLISACQKLKEKGLSFICNFVGSGPIEDDLKKQVDASGLSDEVFFRGFVPPNEMTDWYGKSDVLVMPSIIDPKGDRDGLPNVCLEAMNHGLPIIGSQVSGIPEGVTDGKNGWLVPPADIEKLATAMEDAIVSDKIFAMKKAARKMVIDNFGLKNNIKALKQLMEHHQRKS